MSVLPLQVLHMRINKLNTNNIPAWVGKIVECLSEFPQNYICKTNINVILYFKNNFHSDTNETIWGGKRVIYTDNFEIMHFECFISKYIKRVKLILTQLSLFASTEIFC